MAPSLVTTMLKVSCTEKVAVMLLPQILYFVEQGQTMSQRDDVSPIAQGQPSNTATNTSNRRPTDSEVVSSRLEVGHPFVVKGRNAFKEMGRERVLVEGPVQPVGEKIAMALSGGRIGTKL